MGPEAPTMAPPTPDMLPQMPNPELIDRPPVGLSDAGLERLGEFKEVVGNPAEVLVQEHVDARLEQINDAGAVGGEIAVSVFIGTTGKPAVSSSVRMIFGSDETIDSAQPAFYVVDEEGATEFATEADTINAMESQFVEEITDTDVINAMEAQLVETKDMEFGSSPAPAEVINDYEQADFDIAFTEMVAGIENTSPVNEIEAEKREATTHIISEVIAEMEQSEPGDAEALMLAEIAEDAEQTEEIMRELPEALIAAAIEFEAVAATAETAEQAMEAIQQQRMHIVAETYEHDEITDEIVQIIRYSALMILMIRADIDAETNPEDSDISLEEILNASPDYAMAA